METKRKRKSQRSLRLALKRKCRERGYPFTHRLLEVANFIFASFCTKMNAPDLLPPRGFNCYKHGINSDLREALSVMEVGEHSDWPVQCEKTVRIIAKRLGVRVASRRLGRKDKVTIYRVS